VLLTWTSQHNKMGNFNYIPEIKEGCNWIKTGPYKWIRHPMYTSVLLLGIAAFLYGFTYFKIGVIVVLTVVLVLKARREEGFWCDKTKEYRDYIKNTKMFIPYIL